MKKCDKKLFLPENLTETPPVDLENPPLTMLPFGGFHTWWYPYWAGWFI
jgi:hypothetical protein